MDGWTDMIDAFAAEGLLHEGRFFCLVGIVLGNFVFSNIFIAIIIMQISEATEAFRVKVHAHYFCLKNYQTDRSLWDFHLLNLKHF